MIIYILESSRTNNIRNQPIYYKWKRLYCTVHGYVKCHVPYSSSNDNSLLKEAVRGLFELTFSNAFRYMHRHQQFNIYVNYLTCKSFDLEHTWWRLFQKCVAGTTIYIYVWIATRWSSPLMVNYMLSWVHVTYTHESVFLHRHDLSDIFTIEISSFFKKCNYY